MPHDTDHELDRGCKRTTETWWTANIIPSVDLSRPLTIYLYTPMQVSLVIPNADIAVFQ